jgi:hypothetical protein
MVRAASARMVSADDESGFTNVGIVPEVHRSEVFDGAHIL